ncbi:MamL-1 domain protein [Necator americanus]|uniref:MamL-1 domain protein n=1 Tax=Necator americanus TaxID=51031 RepID=W2SSG0_NECAM|nr:MamL-1 domain protein [Necator americanus]ETN72570.1 MamL-1 domain protein [Necator americanus]
MQVAMMPGQSPSSTLNGNASTPDPPVPTSDGDRLRASMEAWKRSAAVASERYGEARQRQIAAERDDRQELRKRWLEEEAKKRAENVGKHKDGMSNNLTSSMPPPLYQSTPINNRDNRKRHLDTNDYGHEEWRQGFRMMEGCGMPDMSKTSTDMYSNMSYPPAGAGFYPGMMMPGMRQQSVKNVGPGFSPAPFPNNGAYPAGSFPPNNSLPNAANGQFPSSKSTPSFQGSSFSAPNTAPSTMSCSSMPSTSTADSILSQRFPSMELPQFPVSSDSTPTLPQPPQQTQFSGSDSTSYNCGMRPSPSMCPTSPNEVPTPPALASSGSVQVGSSCPNSTAVVEQNLRSPAEDLGCNAVNEDNMTRMLTSIRTDSLGMLGADAVDSLFDSDTNGESGAGQVPVVTSTDNTSSPAGFSHGGPQSVHSVHSAPQSNGNCNPPSTPTAAATTPSAPHSTSYSQQVSAPQSTSFPQASPSQSSAFPQPSPSQQTGYPQPAAHGQPSPFTQNSQSQATFFAQPSSSQSTNFPATSVGQTTSFPIAPSSQTAGFATAPAQSSAFPPQNVMQQNAFPQQMQTGGGFQQQAPMPTSNPYPAAPGYDMSQAQMNQQQQFAMQAQQQQQMAMGVGGAGAAMSAQQYHMVMMQKHQQHMKAMMQQRAALMYQNYPNGAAAMSQQQYFMHMQKMQQTRFANGVDPSASAFMGSQRVMGMRGGPVAPGSMMEPMAPTGGYPGYAQGMQSFAAQQQYVGQFSMN